MEYPDTLGRPETVTFNGVTYRLMGGRRYYLSQSTSNEGRRQAKGLHVAIYEHFHKTEVPKGTRTNCHHLDGNPFNNAPGNLEVVSAAEHKRRHPRKLTAEQRVVHQRAIDAARAWHATPEGLAWHRANGLRQWAGKTEYKSPPCKRCGKPTKPSRGPGLAYCDSWCNFKALQAQGKYDRGARCAWCGKAFVARPSSPGRYASTCGRPCRKRWVDAGKPCTAAHP